MIIRSYRRTLSGDRRRLLERFRYVHSARKVVGVGSVGTRCLDRAPARSRRARPALPPGQRSRALGARALPREERVRDQRPARRRGSEADAGGKRHHARLASRDRRRRRRARLLRPPALGREGAPQSSRRWSRRRWRRTRRSAAGRWPRHTPRSGDSVAIASYLGSSDSFDRSMTAFAETYADQNEKDYAALVEAVKTGQVSAEEGL